MAVYAFYIFDRHGMSLTSETSCEAPDLGSRIEGSAPLQNYVPPHRRERHGIRDSLMTCNSGVHIQEEVLSGGYEAAASPLDPGVAPGILERWKGPGIK